MGISVPHNLLYNVLRGYLSWLGCRDATDAHRLIKRLCELSNVTDKHTIQKLFILWQCDNNDDIESMDWGSSVPGKNLVETFTIRE